MHRVILVCILAMLFRGPLDAEQLKPETLAAFGHYVELSEQRMSNEMRSGPFLHLEGLPAEERTAEYERLEKAEVLTQQLKTLDDGRPIPVPGGLIHHWLGTVFIPGATLGRTLAFLQDYDNQYKFYAPDVQQSRLMQRNGNEFKVFLRLRKTKVVTVILNTEYDVKYIPLDVDHAASNSYSTRIAEVEHAGQSDESQRPVGDDSGFLWRLNSYWRFSEHDGGTYVQLEAISLTRDIPAGLGWLISPFIRSIPRESLVFTLRHTRDALMENSTRRDSITSGAAPDTANYSF